MNQQLSIRPQQKKTASDLWCMLQNDVELAFTQEPILSRVFGHVAADLRSFEYAMASLLANKLSSSKLEAQELQKSIVGFYEDCPDATQSANTDIAAIREKDPACNSNMEAMFFMKGFQALQAYRFSHWLWAIGRRHYALLIQNKISQSFGVDIHPAAIIGNGILLDHATNVVIGETAVVGDDVTILQGVTLGGTGKDKGDRHPKVKNGVQIWANATLLGNIRIGQFCQIGASSVVLKDVPDFSTVVGIPGRVVRVSRPLN